MLVGPSHEGGSGPDGLKEAVTLFLWTPLVEYRIRGRSFHIKHAKGVERHDLCGLFLRPFRDACDYADTVGFAYTLQAHREGWSAHRLCDDVLSVAQGTCISH